MTFQSLGLRVGFRYQVKHFSEFSTQAADCRVKFEDEWNAAKPFDSIPKLTKIETLRRFMPGGKYHKVPLNNLHRLMKAEFGDIVLMPALLGRPQLAMTFSVNDFEKLFRSEGQYPNRRAIETLAYYRETVRPDIYNEYGGLFNEQGEAWAKMRKIISPVMLQPKTVKLYVPQVEEIANDFISMIMQKRDEKNEVPANFGNFINMWSLESIAFITLSRRLGILNENNQDENAKKLIKLIREFFERAYDFEVNPSVWRYYKSKAFKELMAVYDGITSIVMHYIDEAIEEIKSDPLTEDREESILGKILKIDKKVAVVMCADALLAGVDTTASATLGILFCLAKNQDKQQKLREELLKILPGKDDKLTPDKMRNMPYLRAVLKEGIRLFPPTSGNIRKADQDLVLSGYRIPKGLEVAMAGQLIQSMEKHFERAPEFIPERWMKEKSDGCPPVKDSNPFAYLPFGFGARMCVGKRLAELEIEILVSRIVRNFNIQWQYPDMRVKSVLVNIPEGDLKFKFTEI